MITIQPLIGSDNYMTYDKYRAASFPIAAGLGLQRAASVMQVPRLQYVEYR